MKKLSDQKSNKTTKKGLLIKIDPELHTKLKILATQDGTDMTNIVLKLIESYIEKKSNDKDSV